MKKLIVFPSLASLVLGIASLVLYKALGGIYLTFAITFLTTFYHFAMRVFIACVINVLRKDEAEKDVLSFRLCKAEKSFYKFIGLKKWKKYAPTYNKELFSLNKNTYRRVYHNMTNAEIGHGIIVLFSFLPLAFSLPLSGFIPFFITSVFAACFDMQFVFIQRLNKERLSIIMAKKTPNYPLFFNI